MNLWKQTLRSLAASFLKTDNFEGGTVERNQPEPEPPLGDRELKELREKNANLAKQNQKLEDGLRELREAYRQILEPPNSYGTILQVNEPDFNEDEDLAEPAWTADIYTGSRKMRVTIDPKIIKTNGIPQPGQEVLLNTESMSIITVLEEESSGEIVLLKELLDNKTRAVVISKGDDERVLDISENLRIQPLKPGDSLLANLRSNILLERLPKSEVENLILEEIPDVTYENVAGLDAQIEQIRDAVELPFIHQELFTEHRLTPPKGILLYGPPGCGKTLIAKAVANSLANNRKLLGSENLMSTFISIKGPELLNKYVGETERQIRLIFQRAREKSKEGGPVIVFFDEMESLFRMRGSGISSDMESTVVPQLLSEIDGLETMQNVIVIGASNREDLIDPAILRPGRLDVKIKIERPNSEVAQAIFGCYLLEELPISESEIQISGGGDKAKAIQSMIEKTVEYMYATEEQNRFLEVTYMDGDQEVMYFKDFASGAMIENIVRRAKKIAIKRYLRLKDQDSDLDKGASDTSPDLKDEDLQGGKGICLDDLLTAVSEEFREHEDLPNTTNPDDWAKISGKKGQRISFVRTLLQDQDTNTRGGKSIEQIGSGQYL